MKKTLSVLLLCATLLSLLASCASGGTAVTDAPAPATEAPQPEETTAEPVETTEEETETPPETVDVTAPEYVFRHDNFADGKLSDELLDSVSPGVLALLSECMYFEAELQKGIAAGQKWVYSNSSTYVPQSGSFDSMLKGRKYGANCAMPQGWAMVDFQLTPDGKHLYGDSNGGLARFSDYGKYVCAVATVTSWLGKYTFKQLYAAQMVKPGDIFYCKGHTFIYLGDELFMAAGHDGKWHSEQNAPTDDSRKAVFDTWLCDMKTNTDFNYSIYWQIRFKDEYVPIAYRNAEGKLVECPLYDAETSIMYKKGVSSEKSVCTLGKLK